MKLLSSAEVVIRLDKHELLSRLTDNQKIIIATAIVSPGIYIIKEMDTEYTRLHTVLGQIEYDIKKEIELQTRRNMMPLKNQMDAIRSSISKMSSELRSR